MSRTWITGALSTHDLARHAIRGLERAFHPAHPGRRVLAREMQAALGGCDARRHGRHLTRVENRKRPARPALERPVMRHARLELPLHLGEGVADNLDAEPDA